MVKSNPAHSVAKKSPCFLAQGFFLHYDLDKPDLAVIRGTAGARELRDKV